MKKRLLLLVCLCSMLTSLTLSAQIQLKGFHQDRINPQLLKERWDARWIALPEEPRNAYGVYHFRKSFDMAAQPESFIVHVSADNRYKLYVNGVEVALGPARSDVFNWNFETVDIAPWLKPGKNVLAAVVWNFAEHKAVPQTSFNQTGFILQGNDVAEAVVNTNDTWLCTTNKAYTPHTKSVYGYYAAGPGERVDAALYPWGWEKPEFNDTAWVRAASGLQGATKGARDYPGRLLVPTPIPPMEYAVLRPASIREASDGLTLPKGFPVQAKPLVIPAHKSVELLLDNDSLTTAYLSLLFSKGRGAEITIGYAEALYADTEQYNKGNRNEIASKTFIGYEDQIVADGGQDQLYTTLWWRTWRYLRLTIVTADEPLVLEDIYGTFTAYPFQRESTFAAKGHDQLSDMLDIGWRTARLCANETYMDCPYYEQLQYFGDTRIQAMISLYNTRDNHMVRNALEQGRQSIVADGITMSRYPSGLHQFISSFSLYWICMGHDYWRYRGEEEYLKSLLPSFRGVLSWYEGFLKEDGSLDYVPHWFFADWASNFDSGEPFREEHGNSAFQDLLFVMALESMADMESGFGIPMYGERYATMAKTIKSSIKRKYWDPSRNLFADTYDKRNYSQHVNVLAILLGVVEGADAAALMHQTLTDKSLTQTTIYFRYYLNQALKKAGLGDLLLDNMQIWKDQMALGLTTWAEQPEPSRSDCHAWGSSPNIEFFRIILGIDSDAPGFEQVVIAPSLGELTEVSGTMPHPNGAVSVSYQLNKKKQCVATIGLPEGVTGRFIWNGTEYPLHGSTQTITTK